MWSDLCVEFMYCWLTSVLLFFQFLTDNNCHKGNSKMCLFFICDLLRRAILVGVITLNKSLSTINIVVGNFWKLSTLNRQSLLSTPTKKLLLTSND